METILFMTFSMIDNLKTNVNIVLQNTFSIYYYNVIFMGKDKHWEF